MALIELLEYDTLFVKTVLKEVADSTNAALQAGDNWFTQNGQTLYSVCGVNAYVVEYFKNNPDKLPSIVILRPYDEIVSGGGIMEVTIPKTIIVCAYDKEDNLTDREEITEKPVLFPVYEEYLKQIAKHQFVVDGEWTNINHTRTFFPGWQPADSQLDLYLDAIIISNLKIKFFTPLNC